MESVHPFLPIVRASLLRAPEILIALKRSSSPCYLFDAGTAARVANEYLDSFQKEVFGHRAFYAVKSNPAIELLRTLTRCGLGMDVSSPEEGELAQEADAEHIVFSGPAKRVEDLVAVLRRFPGAVVHLDSWAELERVQTAATNLGIQIRCGVRVFPAAPYAWEKFGIPLERLGEFWRAAAQYSAVKLCGVQFHRSGNLDASRYTESLAAVARALTDQLAPQEREKLEFIDVGGGFMANACEAPYDEPFQAALLSGSGVASRLAAELPYTVQTVSTVAEYASQIGAAVRRYITPIVTAELWTEPGRVLANPAFDLVLTVVDVKDGGVVIVDGGENMIGWDKYLQRYAPVINLTHQAESEIPVTLAGSLCDPDDVWGFRCFASEICPGDVLLIPGQGAYTFAHAKRFIRGIPPIVSLHR